jgi:cyclophilin family peptidyl-prolyl cis-trans isomerase/HEAT repeat protein
VIQSLIKRHEVKFLLACMALLALAAGWLLSSRPGHRIETDFLTREQQRQLDVWLFGQSRSNTVAEERARACLALGRIGGESATARLIEALNDPAASVRAYAAFGLGLIGDRDWMEGREPNAQAASALGRVLQDEDRRVVTYAVEALGKMRWQRLGRAIASTPAPLAVTLTALVRMDDARFADWMTSATRSDDQDIRWAAAVALEELQAPVTEDMTRAYLRLAKDRNDFVRAAVARGLGRLAPNEDVFNVLRILSKDRDPKIRFEAVRSLGALADAGNTAPLEEAVADENPLIRAEAERAIRALVEDVADPLPPRDPSPSAAPLAGEPLRFEFSELPNISRTIARRLIMETSLGEFEITLDYNNAPLAAERFYRLATSGAYDGAAFGQVRPNGYAQAAPAKPMGPLLPEFNTQPFLRGSMGMVRSGPDSDSAEFFIATTPLLFADTRYTNFGRLVSGDNILDRITPGTRIIAIREP